MASGDVDTMFARIGAAFPLRSPVRRFVFFLILLAAIFSRPLFNLVGYAAGSNVHSYILLIPFISAYLIYTRRERLPKTYSSSPGMAAIWFIAGLAAVFLATKSGISAADGYLTLMALSFVCFAIGEGFLFLGRDWMWAAAFPFALSFFIVPLPEPWVNILETASQVASSEAANLFFNITGTPVLRERTIFELPNITFEVGQECSGIRSSLVLIITSLVGANLFLKSPWRRAALIAFVIPLGIIRNGLRVWVIGTLCTNYGPQMIHSVIHRRGGPPFFVLSLIPLFLLLLWLRRRESRNGIDKQPE